jgi:hypothetical protein
VDSSIALAPGADGNPLAEWLREVVSHNAGGAARRDFRSLRAAVALVAPDTRHKVTLRFDHGYLTIHDGIVGIPDVTFCADEPLLRALATLPMSRLGRLPLPAWRGVRNGNLRETLAELASGELKIYGMLSHGRTVLRVLRLLSAP